MYINKNKGFSLIEIVTTLTIVMVIFQVIYVYLREINNEKKRELYRFSYNKNIKLILDRIDFSLYESLEYKIYNINEINSYIDYTKPTLKIGNVLIIEKYVPWEEKYTEIEIYYYKLNSLYSFSGKRKRKNEIAVLVGTREKILKNLDINFYLEDYGVSMKGVYLNEQIRKDFKK